MLAPSCSEGRNCPILMTLLSSLALFRDRPSNSTAINPKTLRLKMSVPTTHLIQEALPQNNPVLNNLHSNYLSSESSCPEYHI